MDVTPAVPCHCECSRAISDQSSACGAMVSPHDDDTRPRLDFESSDSACCKLIPPVFSLNRDRCASARLVSMIRHDCGSPRIDGLWREDQAIKSNGNPTGFMRNVSETSCRFLRGINPMSHNVHARDRDNQHGATGPQRHVLSAPDQRPRTTIAWLTIPPAGAQPAGNVKTARQANRFRAMPSSWLPHVQGRAFHAWGKSHLTLPREVAIELIEAALGSLCAPHEVRLRCSPPKPRLDPSMVLFLETCQRSEPRHASV
jgi:hypothetical protein